MRDGQLGNEWKDLSRSLKGEAGKGETRKSAGC